jgi:hypothetical protein
MSRFIGEHVKSLGSLAQRTRLSAFRHLHSAHWSSLSGGDIARLCGAPHITMSMHLSILMRAGPIVIEHQDRMMNDRADVGSLNAVWPLPDAGKFTESLTGRVTLFNKLYAMIRRRIQLFTGLASLAGWRGTAR